MIVYEFDGQSGHVEPLLLLRRQPSQQRTSFIEEELEDESQGSTNHSLIWPMQNKDMQPFPSVYMDVDHAPLEAASSDMSASYVPISYFPIPPLSPCSLETPML